MAKLNDSIQNLQELNTVVSKKRTKSSRDNSKLYLWLFLAPAVIYLTVWKFIPLLFTVFLSFTSWNPLKGEPITFVGVQNFLYIFQDKSFLHSLTTTMFFLVVAVLIELMLGLCIALILDEGLRGENIYKTLLLIPMVIAPAVVGTIWYILFHDTLGPMSYIFGEGWLTDPDRAIYSIILTDIWHWTPFMFLLIISALQVFPRDLYEAASVDGAKWYHILWYVKLPMLRYTIVAAIILRSMDAFRIFDEIMIMTGGGPGNSTETTSLLIHKNAFKFFETGYASAMVVVLLIFTVMMYIGYMKRMRME
ncbi:ABC transporter permease [Bacillus sp. M6-12]|uniref:carbohydrate ABC transporter permease n=1 Tax=Bacillus sp. M6-12 TaxID=2054166 RepID=UPI000C767576|nr:sugar ABC transporter permease [Bacillus sp. M6-12]PLS16132.1 ABC transporter permease [Bacillus sp. M6-12]